MSTIPNEEACIRILMEEGCSDRVIRHTCTVMRLAVEMAKRCNADVDLVRAGGLLHDIGRSRTHGVRHAVEGAAIALSRGLPDELVQVIRKHMGAGFTEEEAEGMGLPPGDYMPRTLEEKIVCHADNLVGDCAYMTSMEAYQDIVRKGYPITAERMLAMHRELSTACGEDIDELAERIKLSVAKGPCAKYLVGC